MLLYFEKYVRLDFIGIIRNVTVCNNETDEFHRTRNKLCALSSRESGIYSKGFGMYLSNKWCHIVYTFANAIGRVHCSLSYIFWLRTGSAAQKEDKEKIEKTKPQPYKRSSRFKSSVSKTSAEDLGSTRRSVVGRARVWRRRKCPTPERRVCVMRGYPDYNLWIMSVSALRVFVSSNTLHGHKSQLCAVCEVMSNATAPWTGAHLQVTHVEGYSRDLVILLENFMYLYEASAKYCVHVLHCTRSGWTNGPVSSAILDSVPSQAN